MTENKPAAPAKGQAGIDFGTIKSTNKRKIRKGTKRLRILAALVDNSSLDFQQARKFGDSCLHSTVSDIQLCFGIQVHRELKIVTGWNGNPTRCCGYSLDEFNRQKAIKFLREVV